MTDTIGKLFIVVGRGVESVWEVGIFRRFLKKTWFPIFCCALGHS